MQEENKQSYQRSSLDDALDSIDLDDSPRSPQPPQEKPKKLDVKAFIKEIWNNPKKRKIALSTLAGVVLILGIVPHSRYFLMNSVGVRSSASVKVLDESTGQPLKNVAVKIRNTEVKTDNNGLAKFEKIKLGSAQLIINKRAFAEISRNITIGWGSNPLGDTKLKPVGVQYSFDIKDFLSDKPIDKAEAYTDDYSAFSNPDGRVVLTIEEPGDDVITINIRADGYREEQISQITDNKEAQTVNMVPNRKHLFVSKRSGKFDVYKIDVDGKNEQLVLSGTGNEREDMSLVSHPDRNVAALVSTRENRRNKDGFLLSALTLIDVTTGETITSQIESSERVQIIGWSGDQLVYVKIAAGASASTPDRHRLITYNYDTGQSKEIAKSNYFNDVQMIGGEVYYAPSGAYQDGPVGFYKVNANGENQKKIIDQEVWSIFRTGYDKVSFSVQNDWYEYLIKDGKVLAASGPPPVQLTRVYVDGPDNQQSLWVDQRDGKGALVAYNSENQEEKTVRSQSGLTYPVRWMSKTAIVYRISTQQETADYIISLEGGEPKKIKDVTNTGGVDRWYYY